MAKHALGCLLGLSAMVAQADYSAELRTGASVERIRWDNDAFFQVDDQRAHALDAELNLYFDAVQSEGPLNEAAYMQRAGFLRLNWREQDGEYRHDKELENDQKAVSAKAFIVIEDMIIWDIRLGRFKESDDFTPHKYDNAQLHFGMGSYFLGNHSVTIGLQYNQYKAADQYRYDSYGIVADYRSVLALGSQHLAFGGGIGVHVGEYERRYLYTNDDVETVRFGLNGFVSYYPINNFSVTASLMVNADAAVHDDADDTVSLAAQSELTVAVRYFPLTFLSLDASVTSGAMSMMFEDDLQDEDVDGDKLAAKVGFSVRF